MIRNREHLSDQLIDNGYYNLACAVIAQAICDYYGGTRKGKPLDSRSACAKIRAESGLFLKCGRAADLIGVEQRYIDKLCREYERSIRR